jgi:hypothetical protein
MAEGGKLKEILESGQAPYGYVRGGGSAGGGGQRRGYWSRERTERAIKGCPDEESLKREVPIDVLAGALESVSPTDHESVEWCKSHFKKMPSAAIRKASGQPPPLPEFRTEDDE